MWKRFLVLHLTLLFTWNAPSHYVRSETHKISAISNGNAIFHRQKKPLHTKSSYFYFSIYKGNNRIFLVQNGWKTKTTYRVNKANQTQRRSNTFQQHTTAGIAGDLEPETSLVSRGQARSAGMPWTFCKKGTSWKVRSVTGNDFIALCPFLLLWWYELFLMKGKL